MVSSLAMVGYTGKNCISWSIKGRIYLLKHAATMQNRFSSLCRPIPKLWPRKQTDWMTNSAPKVSQKKMYIRCFDLLRVGGFGSTYLETACYHHLPVMCHHLPFHIFHDLLWYSSCLQIMDNTTLPWFFHGVSMVAPWLLHRSVPLSQVVAMAMEYKASEPKHRYR